MKSSEFRHLYDHVCSKEVSLLCFVKFIALVFYDVEKKNDVKKRDSDVSKISSISERRSSKKKTWAELEKFSLVRMDIISFL